MLCSFALFVSSFVSIGPEKPHRGSDQVRYLFIYTVLLHVVLGCPTFLFPSGCHSIATMQSTLLPFLITWWQWKAHKNTIDKLQVYNGNAIRDNSHDLPAIKNAVMAIWSHTQSTDKSPDHDHVGFNRMERKEIQINNIDILYRSQWLTSFYPHLKL